MTLDLDTIAKAYFPESDERAARCLAALRAVLGRCIDIVEDETKHGHWSSQHLLRKALAKELRDSQDRTEAKE